MMLAGDGGSGGASDAAGAGGDLQRIAILGTAVAGNITLHAGVGGTLVVGTFGPGGAVDHILLKVGDLAGDLNLSAGVGTLGADSSLRFVSATLASVHGNVTISGSDWGLQTRVPWSFGGSVENVLLQVAGRIDGQLKVAGGTGASAYDTPAYSNPAAGGGGSVTNVLIQAGSAAGGLEVLGGNGGAGLVMSQSNPIPGGFGGSVQQVQVNVDGSGAGSPTAVTIRGGDDGASIIPFYSVINAGGSLNSITVHAGSLGAISLRGGDGGEASSMFDNSGIGERGGAIQNVAVMADSVHGDVVIATGIDGGVVGDPSRFSSALLNAAVVNVGTIDGRLELSGGAMGYYTMVGNVAVNVGAVAGEVLVQTPSASPFGNIASVAINAGRAGAVHILGGSGHSQAASKY